MKTKTIKPLLAATGVALATFACKTDKTEPHAEDSPHVINLADMDTTVRPAEDFFRYVNGTWLDENPIPDDETIWGSFGALRKKTNEDVLNILKNAMDDPNIEAGSDQAKAVYLFKSILDTVSRNEAGIEPI